MANDPQFVSAVHLKRIQLFASLDRKLQRGQLSTQELLATPLSPSISIPITLGSPLRSLLFQWQFRLPKIGGYWATGGWMPTGVPDGLVRLMLRDAAGKSHVLSVGPTLVGWDSGFTTIRWPWIQSVSPARWLTMSVQFGANGIRAWCNAAEDTGLDFRLSDPAMNVEALIIAIDQNGWAGEEPEIMLADLRLWKVQADSEVEALRSLMDIRLDGREPGLLGYWKLNEGQGTRIGDSAHFRLHGVLNGGQWVGAGIGGSGLSLNPEREQNRNDLQQRQTELNQQALAYRTALEDLAKLNQERTRLNDRITQLKEQGNTLTAELEIKNKEAEAAKNELNASFVAWQKDIEDGGKVAVGAFSNGIALELDRVNQRMTAAQTPYALQAVALQIRALPVAEAGGTGMRLRFPSLDDQKIQSDQLSTLKLDFALRAEDAARALSAIPDVQDCTETLARRMLSSAGFRVEVSEQAVERIETVGRVVRQVPSPDILAEPDKIVRIFIGKGVDGIRETGGGN